MCGGIIAALTFSLPENIRNNRWRLLPYVSAYNFGIISSYSLAGAITGSIGENITPENLPGEIQANIKTSSSNSFCLPDDGIVLEKIEADFIDQAMNKSHGNQSKAARLLGLSRSALLYRMKKYVL